MALARGPYSESLNSTINGYRKIKKVGEGAFGTTYHVTKGRQDYALKKLKSFQMTRAVYNATMTEITILRNLKHGNVVSYVESFSEGYNKIYIVMEYCKIGNLGMLIDSRDPRAAEERFIVGVMTQLCRAMEYIHSKKIIHRDIKPTNIFLQSEGVLKLGDFGLSKVVQSSGYAMTMCGTPGYISPESLAGLPYNFSSDMWSIGRVLFDLCNRGAEGWHPRRITIPTGYSKDLKTLLGNLLSNDPKYRPSAAKAQTTFSQMDSTLRSRDDTLGMEMMSLNAPGGLVGRDRRFPQGASAGAQMALIFDIDAFVAEMISLLLLSVAIGDGDDDDLNRLATRALRR